MEALAAVNLGLTDAGSCACCSHGDAAKTAKLKETAAVVREYVLTG